MWGWRTRFIVDDVRELLEIEADRVGGEGVGLKEGSLVIGILRLN
jgi:hypothetical protein